MWLAIGQYWLAAIATLSASILRVTARSSVGSAAILVAVALIGLVLIAENTVLLRRARRLPAGPPEGAAVGRTMGLRFGLTVLSAVVIIGAGNLILTATGHGDWIVPYTYLIVGLHFPPLAFVFGVRPYVVLGVLWVVVVIVTVAATSPGLDAGQGLSAWVVLPIGGCGVVTWPVIGYIIVSSVRTLQPAALSTQETA